MGELLKKIDFVGKVCAFGKVGLFLLVVGDLVYFNSVGKGREKGCIFLIVVFSYFGCFLMILEGYFENFYYKEKEKVNLEYRTKKKKVSRAKSDSDCNSDSQTNKHRR